ncbi:MAG: hypothetical protein ACKORJ_01675 [Bacteroidota bacterium]
MDSPPSGIGGQHAHLKVDLDFWYNPTVNNFERLINALEDLEIDTEDLRTIVFDKKRTFIKIPYEHFHTDFLPVIEGIDLTIKEISIPILSLDDLIKNYQFLNRPTDRVDIENLIVIKKIRRDQSQ